MVMNYANEGAKPKATTRLLVFQKVIFYLNFGIRRQCFQSASATIWWSFVLQVNSAKLPKSNNNSWKSWFLNNSFIRRVALAYQKQRRRRWQWWLLNKFPTTAFNYSDGWFCLRLLRACAWQTDGFIYIYIYSLNFTRLRFFRLPSVL
jgi:hypothetical protein